MQDGDVPYNCDDLLADLRSAEFVTRDHAVVQLSALGAPAIPWLLTALWVERQPSVRIGLVETLAHIGRVAWEPLLEGFGATQASDNINSGWLVYWALQRFVSVCGVDDYLVALRHPNVHVRWASARILGQFTDERVVEALVSALAEDGPPSIPNYHYKVCAYAADSLRQIGSLAFPSLVTALRNTNPLVRAGAAEALTGANDARLFEPLVEAADDPDPAVRNRVIAALTTLAPMLSDEQRLRARDALVNALLEPDPLTRFMAPQGLCDIGSSAVDALIDIVQDSGLDAGHPYARGYAMRALSCILSKEPPRSGLGQRVFPLLVDALREQLNPSLLRQEAAVALGNTRDTRALALLITALADTDPYVQQATVKALGALGDSREIPALEDALRLARSKLDNNADNDEADAAYEDFRWLVEIAIAALGGDQPAEES